MKPDIIEILKVILLGIIEGITEWLPISSTGHMLLVDEFITLRMSDAFKEMFFIVIQLGAIIAVVVLFWSKIWPFQFRDKNQPVIRKDIISLWFKVAVACIPGAIAAHTPLVISAALIVYGIAFILIEEWNKNSAPKALSINDITYMTALVIGLFQVLSIIPGTSRSGATILGALMIGVSRVAAAEFTFYLAIPAMVGLSAYKMLKFGFTLTSTELMVLIIGMVTAFAVSMAVIRFLMSYIRKHDFKAFGWYRIVLGAVVILYFIIL